MWSKDQPCSLCNINVWLYIMMAVLPLCCPDKGQDKMWTPPFCPKLCTCSLSRYEPPTQGKLMKTINCSEAGLGSVPKNLSNQVEVIMLKGNRIKYLKIRDILNYLKHFDVSSNRISKIDNRLQKLTHLKSLDLHNNSLSYLPNGQFSGLKFLAYLDLSNNVLHSIEKHSFGGLNYLQRLNLEGNKLSFLEREWFLSMPSLRWLYLSRNNLRNIEPNMFETLANLAELRLDHNNIFNIGDDAFHGMNELSTLDLSFNKLSRVPDGTVLSVASLQCLYLDGNPIYRISRGAFKNLNVSLIRARYMPNLNVIEKQAFKNLPQLQILELHDNPMLIYVDSDAFSNVPRLKSLYLHNNRLFAVPRAIRTGLPSLEKIHIYNNNLRCDCNAYWIRQELVKEEQQPNFTSVLYEESVLRCDSPPNLSGRLLKMLPKKAINKTCAPSALPLFGTSYNISVGEELRLECHALGVPDPQIKWRLPNGTMLSGSVKSGRVQVFGNCTLIVRHLRPSDSGTYLCKAMNQNGFDISSTSVMVNNKPIRIIPSSIAGDYVTIMWNGTTYRSMISDYQIHYRVPSSTIQYSTIHLGQFATRYTFTNLKPLTMYEFCIVYVYDTEQYTVDCVNVTTTQPGELPMGITRIDKRIIIGSCAVILLAIALGCVIAVARRFRRHKEYLEPTSHEKSEAMAHIPLDNFYNPPTTPLCSSRTSLISAQD
ncbi:leucine-rich repeat neuronal protein 1-like [Mizuhopecten yessoensis]|uniref:Leucine-rich repeat neuronal protein 1 n=1 Tax=Mizuhopecten yessoensis TaxID=6573 RepID=A0A210R3E5_MIZYE|nr:leucine-rich repeat neuronal protein 1-like [Mizuhopecten yessoensis]XP_021365174.1 leucine-rich repeat neuronal protein 1-like [Mizuhopecten yessoensis]OWF55600.1 Leucine-rich repeat neuronal protein 1 [Mizuhopecten yessoensis]